MARPLDYVLSEILRVADDAGLDPRLMRRKEFLPHSDVSKHDLEKYGGYGKLRSDAAHVGGIEPFKDGPESRGVELRNNYVRGLERKVATADYLADKVLKGFQEVIENNPVTIPAGKVELKKARHRKRTLTLLWSDLHFGVDVDPREILKSEYNWTIASRRMAKLAQQAALWKPEHREETTLQIVLNGDILHGIIHLSEANIKELTEQIWGATAVLTKAIGFLSQHFGAVDVLCLPGNHDRVSYRDSNRALAQRWNSHSHAVYLALKCWFKDEKHVKFDIPMAGLGSYVLPGGHTAFATHGDTEPSTSNVGKSFNVAKTTEALLKMNAGDVFEKKASVVLFGHWHQPSQFMLPDGTVCVVNGSLIGSESFAQNGIGFFNSMPAQVMFESVPDYPVGDFRILQLRDADHNEALDKIIHIPEIERGGLIDF
jgi:predicted phosphodiesterase